MDYRVLNRDLNFGLESEKEKVEIIKEKFGQGLKKVKDNYFVFDFACENCYVELKTRKCELNKYPSTMIGMNKIDYASHTNRPVYFVFAFTDGMYYWKYNKEDFENGNVIINKGGRCDRGINEIKDYAYIKNDILIDLGKSMANQIN